MTCGLRVMTLTVYLWPYTAPFRSPDVVGASGGRGEDEQHPSVLCHDLVPVDERCLARLRRDHPPALGRRADLLERQVDGAAVLRRDAVHHRDIALRDCPSLDGGGEALVRLGIAGEQQAAAGVAVQPVHRQRPALEADGPRGQEIGREGWRTREGQ